MTRHKDEPDLDQLAAEYALGTLECAERLAVEERMAADPGLQRLVAGWEQRLAPLAEALPAVAPSPELLTRIEADLDREQRRPQVETTMYAEEGEWRAVANGVSIKILAVDAAAGMRSFLLRMEAGARLPAHRHAEVEECLMIAGDLRLGNLTLKAGDYHRMPAGTRHPSGYSLNGCIAFIRGDDQAKT